MFLSGTFYVGGIVALCETFLYPLESANHFPSPTDSHQLSDWTELSLHMACHPPRLWALQSWFVSSRALHYSQCSASAKKHMGRDTMYICECIVYIYEYIVFIHMYNRHGYSVHIHSMNNYQALQWGWDAACLSVHAYIWKYSWPLNNMGVSGINGLHDQKSTYNFRLPPKLNN